MKITGQALEAIPTGPRAGQALCATCVEKDGATLWGFYAMKLWEGGGKLVAPHRIYETREERNKGMRLYWRENFETPRRDRRLVSQAPRDPRGVDPRPWQQEGLALMFKILEIRGYEEGDGPFYVQAVPYVFETEGLARKIAGKLAEQDQNNGGDGAFKVLDLAPRPAPAPAARYEFDMPF